MTFWLDSIVSVSNNMLLQMGKPESLKVELTFDQHRFELQVHLNARIFFPNKYALYASFRTIF